MLKRLERAVTYSNKAVNFRNIAVDCIKALTDMAKKSEIIYEYDR